MPALRARTTVGLSSDPSIDAGTLCRAPSPPPGTLGAGDDVRAWGPEDKLLYAAREAAPLLPAHMRSEFAELFTPANIAITAGLLGAWAASHLFGVGQIVTALLLLTGVLLHGMAAYEIASDVADYFTQSLKARTRTDLEKASVPLARAVSTLGVTVFMALLFKGAKKAPTGRAGASKPKPSGASGRSGTAASTREPFYKRTTTLDHAAQGDGAMAHALRKSQLDDFYKRSSSWMDKGVRVNPKTGLKETGAKIRESHIKGTDLSKPVIRRSLKPGTEIIQFERYGGQPGTYVAYPGTSADQIAVIGNGRIVRRYRVLEQFEVMETTAAPFDGGKVQGVGGAGGGQQLIMPPDWERKVRKLW